MHAYRSGFDYRCIVSTCMHAGVASSACACLVPTWYCTGQYAMCTLSKVLGEAAKPAVARQNATTLATVRTRFRVFHWRRLLLTCTHIQAAFRIDHCVPAHPLLMMAHVGGPGALLVLLWSGADLQATDQSSCIKSSGYNL
jgi:hypothetical protein